MIKFAICVNNKNYEASLEKWKIYPVVKENEVEGYVRIMDESGEDYLYPTEYFSPIELPANIIKNIEKEYSLKIKKF